MLKNGAEVGSRVAIVGAGGIGFDVADFLTHPHSAEGADAMSQKGPKPRVDEVRYTFIIFES